MLAMLCQIQDRVLPSKLVTIPEPRNTTSEFLDVVLEGVRLPDYHDLTFLLSAVANVDLKAY